MSAAISQISLQTKLGFAVGDKTGKALARALDLHTTEDLLRHYPRRYADRGALTDLAKLVPGELVTVMARIKSVKNYSFGPGGRKTRTDVVVSDGTGELKLTFFQQAWRAQRLPVHALGMFAGQVNLFRGERQLTHPDYELFDESGGLEESSRFARGVIPIYHASASMPSWKIMSCVELVLDALGDLDDPLPDSIRTERGFWNLKESFEGIHRPRNTGDYERARARFRYEEAFVIQSIFARRRHATELSAATARPPVTGGLRERFEQRLPFELTGGQIDVVAQLTEDLSKSHPMHRLLQGEVGSGKTVVALLAMLQTVDSGGQAAMLAPTEVLAAQHYRVIVTMLGDLAKGGMLGAEDGATRVRLLTGSMGAKARKESLLDAASGEAGIVVGTHALIQDIVQFSELGLVVVDEQHRFGVEQRAALAGKAVNRPHVLVMTATPIPRTVAMTAFGDLETSVLSELPAGRQPIQTTVVSAATRPAWLERAWQRVREEVGKGRQAYVVCSRIGEDDSESEGEDAPLFEPENAPAFGRVSVLGLYEELAGGHLRGLSLAMLHGRMTPVDKDAAMSKFASGEVDVLIATTVVEVGVDVPNASVMVVMDADRFGVSQLHQLRGRVGRGTEPGLCLLVSYADEDTPAWERLNAVAATTDGFALSRLDVELRHEGDVLGASQSGVRSSLRLLSVVRDESVIVQARDDANALIAEDPDLAAHPVLAEAVRVVESSDEADYLEKT